MLTVYRYGFTPPPPPPKPPETPWGTYLAVGAGLYFAWKQGWLGKISEWSKKVSGGNAQ